MKLLLTGAGGQLGHVLEQRLQHLGEIVAPRRSSLDLSDADAIRDTVTAVQPDLIINAAAYTAVDKAETDAVAAYAINAIAPALLAQQAQRLAIPIIHFSTDYVFPGTGSMPYREDDLPQPRNVYGMSKLAGEHAIAAYCERYWILRTSWVYGAHGGNFLKTIMRLAQERETLNVIDDQIGAPTSTNTIADALCGMLAGSERQSVAQQVGNSSGLYHLTAAGATSWHHYAQTIVKLMGALKIPLRLQDGVIAAIPTSAYPTPAARPRNSRLCLDKLQDTFSIVLPQWQDALSDCIEELTGQRLPPGYSTAGQ